MYSVHPPFGPKLSGKKTFRFHFLIQLFIYLYLETKPISYSWVLFCIRILLLLSRVTLLMYKINKRIKNIYIDIELVLPTYNVHSYFSLNNLGEKLHIILGKIRYVHLWLWSVY